MSKRSSLAALVAGAWLLTLVAGFLAGRRSAPAPDGTVVGATTAVPDRPGTAPEQAGPGRSSRTRLRPAHPDDSAAPGQLAEVLAEVDRNDRTRGFLDFLTRLSDDEFATVAAELTTGPMAELRRNEHAMLLAEWAARDPYAATDYLQSNARDDWERESLLAAWAARDPQAAFDWAGTAPDDGEVNNWVVGALHGIAAADPTLCRQLLEAMEPGPTRERSLRHAAGAIAGLGAEEAGHWLDQIADADLRQTAARSLAKPLARSDTPAAGTWVASLDDAEARRDASEVVAEHWARNDLDAARKWVESLPEDTRTEAAEGVAEQFGRSDPQRGAEWLASLGTNPDLDGARRRFLESAARADPATAIGVVGTLSDQRVRTGYYYRIVGHWAAQDANAARTWVATNAAALPPSLVKRYFK